MPQSKDIANETLSASYCTCVRMYLQIVVFRKRCILIITALRLRENTRASVKYSL
jgi:hypothetical protein